jgi:hypothetical protein
MTDLDPAARLTKVLAILDKADEKRHAGKTVGSMASVMTHGDFIDIRKHIADAIEALSVSAPYALGAGAPTHRHVKRGTTYAVVGEAKFQSSRWLTEAKLVEASEPLAGWLESTFADMQPVVVYRSTENGSLWVRPKAEFEDGRFEALPLPSPGGQP